MSEYKPIRPPTAGLLGFGNTARKVLEPAPEKPAPKRTRPVRNILEVVFTKAEPEFEGASLNPSTLFGRVLIGICKLAEGKKDAEVADADLCVMCWQLWPDVFQLGKHPHPDSLKVRAKLCGPTGLTGMGFIKRTAVSVYSLTPKGVRWWNQFGKFWFENQPRTNT